MKANTFDFTPFSTSFHQFTKIYLHFHYKKSSMKPDTFDFKLSLLSATSISSPQFYHFPHLLLNRKTQKTVSV